MIKFAICDDEPFMVKEISAQLSKYMKEKNITSYSVCCFTNGRALLDSDLDFDLIFLDIQMERPNGMEAAKILRKRNNQSRLIFVTVLKECVFDAFEVEAYDYLLKPLDCDRFKRTVDRAIKALTREIDKSIVIQKGMSCDIIPLSQVIYCEVQGRKLYIHQSNGTIVDYYNKLEDFERRVDGRFFKCHRSYLVNLDYVRGCKAGQVILAQGNVIPVSRLRERDLTQALLRHMKEREF